MYKKEYDDVIERLNISIEDLKLKINNISEVTGFSPSAIYAYKKGAKKPNVDFLISFCKEYKVNTNWLLSGEGEPYKTQNTIETINKDDYVQIAYYGNMQDLLNDRKTTISSTPTHLLDGDMVLNIEDESINKYGSDAVQAIFKKQSYLVNNGDMMLIEYDGKTLVKNVFQAEEPDSYKLVTPSGKYNDITTKKDTVKFIGKKTGIFYSG